MSKGEETRERIVVEAAALFNQRGYEGSSMSELMKATGLEKGGVYRHFSSKEEVAAEAFDYAWQAALHARMHELDAVSNSVDRLKRFVANFVERRSSVPGGCPLLNTAIESDDGNPALRERARKALRQLRDLLSSIVSAGHQAEGDQQRYQRQRSGDSYHLFPRRRTDDGPAGARSRSSDDSSVAS
jgi:TetR/AcrR family transcriptional repressor of nem operon